MLKYGDTVVMPNDALTIDSIDNVVPIKYDAINECWVVCEQDNATHMLISMTVITENKTGKVEYRMIEIGRCNNIYMLADAIVD